MDINSPMKPLVAYHLCPDGFEVSVQASRFHYCTPRSDVGPYSHVELGFPNRTWPDYMAEYENGDVAFYVPIELVERWLREHGGTLDMDTFK